MVGGAIFHTAADLMEREKDIFHAQPDDCGHLKVTIQKFHYFSQVRSAAQISLRKDGFVRATEDPKKQSNRP